VGLKVHGGYSTFTLSDQWRLLLACLLLICGTALDSTNNMRERTRDRDQPEAQGGAFHSVTSFKGSGKEKLSSKKCQKWERIYRRI